MNIPTAFVSGGPTLAGREDGKKTGLSSVFEAVGARNAGKMDNSIFSEGMKNFVPKKKELSGYLKRYAALVSGGAYGAIFN